MNDSRSYVCTLHTKRRTLRFSWKFGSLKFSLFVFFCRYFQLPCHLCYCRYMGDFHLYLATWYIFFFFFFLRQKRMCQVCKQKYYPVPKSRCKSPGSGLFFNTITANHSSLTEPRVSVVPWAFLWVRLLTVCSCLPRFAVATQIRFHVTRAVASATQPGKTNKPHPRFWAKILSKNVRLIHRFLRYIDSLLKKILGQPEAELRILHC